MRTGTGVVEEVCPNGLVRYRPTAIIYIRPAATACVPTMSSSTL